MTPTQIARLLTEDLQPGTLGIRGIDFSKGWMLAIYPDEATKKHLQQYAKSLNLEGADIHDPDEYHVTLRYWKGDYESALKPIIDWCTANVDSRELKCEVTDVETFGTENSLVVRLKSPDLDAFYNELNNSIMKLGAPKPNTDTALPYIGDEYKPHITIADGVPAPPSRKPTFPIVLNKVKLVERGPVLWQSE